MDKQPIAERITDFEHKRAATVAALEAVQQKVSDENRTKTEAERGV